MLSCMEVAHPDEPIELAELRTEDSKVICFVLFLMSIEPPFYNELNLACINMDKSKVDKLGAIALIISEVLKGGWMEDKRKNCMPKGADDEFNVDDLGYFTKSFLIFKGTPMKSPWIKGWKNAVGYQDGQDDQGRPNPASINLIGVQSFCKSISQALLYSISK